MNQVKGYRQAVIDNNPLAFWSFDSDLTTPEGLLADPFGRVQDEIGNQSYGSLTNEGYLLGQPSLVSLQKSVGRSLLLCPTEFRPGIDTAPNAAGMLVEHTDAQNLRENRFSLELLFNKKSEIEYSQISNSFTRPLLRKAGLFLIRFKFGTIGAGGPLSVIFPNSVELNMNGAFDVFYDRIWHLVIRWKSVEVTTGVFHETAEIIADGRLYASNTTIIPDALTEIDSVSPLEIGMDSTQSVGYQNLNTSPLWIDQIALYNQFLTDEQINNHYKKVWTYNEMLRRNFSRYSWFLDDDNYGNAFRTLQYNRGNISGLIEGPDSDYQQAIPGPPDILKSKAIYISDTASLVFDINAMGPVYAFCFWFKIYTNKPGVILSQQNTTWPWSGPLLKIGAVEADRLYYRETYDQPWLVSANKIRYGEWMHLCVQRSGTRLELFLNGALSVRTEQSPIPPTSGTRLRMGTDPTGQQPVGGEFAYLQIFDRVLQPMEIHRIWSYNTLFRIRGVTTIYAKPETLRLRFYNNDTRQLVTEIDSGSNLQNGEYNAEFLDDTPLFLVAFDPNSESMRRRIYGPLIPSEITELPIRI